MLICAHGRAAVETMEPITDYRYRYPSQEGKEAGQMQEGEEAPLDCFSRLPQAARPRY